MNLSSLVFAGQDYDKNPLYIGRARVSGDLIPGKLLIVDHRCHVSYAGKEHKIESCEVLINVMYSWVPCSDGNFPANAVEGGITSNGEILYVGRANHEGIITPGKVQPSHGCIYLPFGDKEHRYTNYEVLVSQSS